MWTKNIIATVVIYSKDCIDDMCNLIVIDFVHKLYILSF